MFGDLDDPDTLRMAWNWLEGAIAGMGTDLFLIVTQLPQTDQSAGHASIRDLFGPRLKHVLMNGLEDCPRSDWEALMANPSLILELQKIVDEEAPIDGRWTEIIDGNPVVRRWAEGSLRRADEPRQPGYADYWRFGFGAN